MKPNGSVDSEISLDLAPPADGGFFVWFSFVASGSVGLGPEPFGHELCHANDISDQEEETSSDSEEEDVPNNCNCNNLELKGEGAIECEKFAKYYRSGVLVNGSRGGMNKEPSESSQGHFREKMFVTSTTFVKLDNFSKYTITDSERRKSKPPRVMVLRVKSDFNSRRQNEQLNQIINIKMPYERLYHRERGYRRCRGGQRKKRFSWKQELVGHHRVGGSLGSRSPWATTA
ncbi:hypothetical protein RHMOL_Rhmol11G0037000 [Rhododendron molle]|uniref:Uncharacterized protein n=1 Tax=Rhododendron molle TaxID=49168 RepID=A0ACC0LPK8_RHOML|nr:hypothetical protein RHMOL_Rhmol11G0037000 [Rhododendron molle]